MFLMVMDANSAKKVKIAVSKIGGDQTTNNYVKFIKKHIPNAECINLYTTPIADFRKVMQECSGFVLTGGEDVHPGRFGKENQVELCEMDLNRDTLEIEAIKIADELNLPILGICRGEQILNVAFGGSLIVDIPTMHKSEKIVHHKDTTNKNLPHSVNVEKGSLLYQITGKTRGEVNSAHHQAIDKVAPGFVVSAFADDGIIEAIERENSTDKPFFLAVQWHPERWESKEFSDKIGQRFAEEVKKKK